MAEKKKKKHAGHGFKRVSIEHHKDNSHTPHFQHEEGPEHDMKHAAANVDEVHDSMQNNMGMPNPGESDADAGNAGLPAQQEASAAGAGPAGAPAGGPATA